MFFCVPEKVFIVSKSYKTKEKSEIRSLENNLDNLNGQLMLASGNDIQNKASSVPLQVLNCSKFTAIITDRNGVVVFENEAVRQLWKYGIDDAAIGVNLLNISPSHKTGLDVAIKDVLSGKKEAVFLNGVSYESVITKEVAYVNISITPRFDGGNIIGSFVQMLEISDLEQRNQLNENIFTYCPIGILIFNTDGIVVKHNRGVGETLGNPDINLVGVNIFELPSLTPYLKILKDAANGTPIYNTRLNFISVFTKRDTHLNVWLIPMYKADKGDKVDSVMVLQQDITAQLNAEDALIKLARTDELTGLVNRREIKERLSYEASRLDRFDSNFSIIISDIDFFKRINDQYGHQIGDQALKIIAHTLRRQVREIDVVARWGGEEFLIFLPGSDVDTAKLTAERLRKNIARLEIPCGDPLLHVDSATEKEHQNQLQSTPHENTVSVTMSFGVFAYRKGVSLDVALDYADQSLYEAKRRGRDQVVCYESH